MFYMTFVMLFMGHSGLSLVVISTAVAHWFKRKIGMATGLASAGYGAGGILLPFLVWLINRYGWQLSFAILGFLTWLIVLPVSLFLRHKPEQYGSLPDGDGAASFRVEGESLSKAYQEEVEFNVAQAVKTRAFWLLSLACSIQFMVLNGITLHIIPHLTNVGLSGRASALVAMFIPICSIPGRLSFGWLGDVFDKKYVLAAVLLMNGLALGILSYGNALGHFVFFVALFGLTFGGVHALRPAMLREYFGRTAFGSIQGLIVAMMTVGGIFGPAFAGRLFDVRGSYLAAWLTFTVVTLAAAPAVLTIRSHKPQKPDN
jgi:sugar phosphate permease